MHRYDISLETGKQDILNIILKKVNRGSKILEFGCGNGRLTQRLRDDLKCEIFIVEYDKDLYEKARLYANDGICSDILDFEWTQMLKNESFDYIIFADVLEHLLDPEKVLMECKQLLGESGEIIMSVPNIAHNDILLQLYDNSLNYSKSGIMDRTHVRMFTYSGVRTLIEQSGYSVHYEDCVCRETGMTEQLEPYNLELSEFLRLLDERKMKNVYQFVFMIEPTERKVKHSFESKIEEHEEVIQRRVYFDRGNGFSDDDMITMYSDRTDPALGLFFEVPEKTRVVRIDPCIKMPCLIKELNVISNRGRINVVYNGEGETTIVFATMFPSLQTSDLENVKWISVSGFIEYGYDFLEKGNQKNLEIAQELLVNTQEVNVILSDRIAALENDNEQLLDWKKECNKKLLFYNNEIDSLKLELENTTASLSEALEENEISRNTISNNQEVILSLIEQNEKKDQALDRCQCDIIKLREELKSNLDVIAEKQEAALEKDKEVALLKEKLHRRKKQLNAFSLDLAEKESELQSFEDLCTQLKLQNEKIQRELALAIEISEKRDKNISHLSRVVEQQESLLNAREYRIKRLEDLIGEYDGSTSWKATKPFRAMGRLFRNYKSGDFSRKQEKKETSSQRIGMQSKSTVILKLEDKKEEHWDFDIQINDYYPLVTVIVPNYNHSAYLRERLESIYNQTYANYEVILLDDCSIDDSRIILEEYQRKYPDKTRCVFNETNCGKIFLQWNKGISLAKGSLIWIAESDDYCSLDFLEKLVPLLSRESVMLAFSRSVFMTEGKETWNTEQYLEEIPGMDWTHEFIMTAANIVAKAFSIKNIIPNVSSAVFRNTGELSAQMQSMMSGMKLSGDWIFYLNLIKGGCIAYTNNTTNYYRIHEQSTSLKVQKTMEYYKEYETVMKWIWNYYRVPDKNLLIVRDILYKHYSALQNKGDIEKVDDYFSVENIKNSAADRKMNILMGCYSIQPGGGETFSIYLANELVKQGQVVTFLDFRMENYIESIRNLIDPKIPVVHLRSWDDFYYVLVQLQGDIIHTHHASVDQAVASWLNREEITTKMIITLHGMYDTMSREICENTLKQIDPVCGRYIYIADKNLVPFEENGYYVENKFRKISNGLPVFEGKKLSRTEYGIGEDDFVLVLASRGIPENGWKEAIEAVTLANSKAKRTIHLLILGEGEIREELEKKSSNYIHFLGIRDNVRDFFALGDAGLVPTRFKGESYPLVIIECLQSGRPVIATDIAEVHNQLDDGNGQLAGILLHLSNWKLDINEISDAICKMCDDMSYYDMLKNRCSDAAKKFDISEVTKAYMDNYREVAGR